MKNYFDLTGQTAVVTGASTGLGVKMAKAFASQGANLVLIARRQNLLEENAAAIEAEFGVEVLPYTCDITDTEKVKAAVAATMERFGRIDILVNNAGTGAGAPAILPLCTVLWEIWRQHVFLIMLQKAALSI